MCNNFYVYALFRPEGPVCYIGKGQGFRWKRSAKYARDTNPHLTNLIRGAGGELPAGHKKHGEAMRARYAALRQRGVIKQDAILV